MLVGSGIELTDSGFCCLSDKVSEGNYVECSVAWFVSWINVRRKKKKQFIMMYGYVFEFLFDMRSQSTSRWRAGKNYE